ncbi:RNA polymerase factor sigma-54 [Parvibaculum sp.]|uniref:RNA polymerase factor sigma-54 n=1 Tax=Parvibaculum sp. TaxID=2024848 RepID=UPI000C409950|nr:RNA polymerase factor sigma-54 [Parvibaculum sp.]HAC57559.1 RNA polymerase sigma-54 factor [Rhodobiaceae bacterium]MAU62556.1 RNA polymerase sigma-54 factor [Parvibaculum sp.]MBO6666505.1 RNA polymerase factor sigma-54 [Parvibaculum sp.]MBO6690900.1 RNA polymerase factor sigma-54 [Parvibaculum sp.]MBO6713126.1 RNA polymerase factor sigma-54 [Parvibaculum sp.]
MALAPRLELRQGQSLVMTPQLQQAIKLLQLSNLELAEYVEQELERNPLLEAGSAEPAERAEERDAHEGEREQVISSETSLSLSEDGPLPGRDGDLDTDYDNVYADESRSDAQNDAAASAPGQTSSDWQNVKGGGGGNADGDFSFEATLTREATLAEHLTEQMNMALKTAGDRMIGAYLIDQVNEAGYMTADTAEVAERLGTDVEDVEAVLQVLQTFEPTGICARNLKECLALQLAERDRLDPAMQLFLDNLELFAKRDFDQLMKITGADREDIASMVEDIRLCNPKPGLAFGGEPVVPVVPDVFVRARADGSWAVEINSETLPRVLVNQQYYAEVSKLSGDASAKAYISECLNNANWLVKSLDQRARTILKVASEIVRQQDGFLVHGIQHLKPLNLKTIAEAISMHESTVSRVTANKYVATPRGIFEMKYFFTSSIASSSGGAAHSAEAVRHRIKELIDVERPDAVLSDDNIVDILKSQGVDIARRTVAKYREALNIPSSVQRRREKKAYA